MSHRANYKLRDLCTINRLRIDCNQTKPKITF